MLCRSFGRSGRSASLSRSFLITFLFLVCTAFGSRALAGPLSGRVVDPHAKAIVGADVLVLRAGAVITRITTVADGRFGPVTLPAGRYEVVVSAAGLRAAPTAVSIDPSAAADITIAMGLSAVSESIVVSASQVDVPLSRATESVTVIDRADLDLRQMEQVADALRLVPGFGVVSNGGRGAVTSIFPRGGESDYTLVLVDGIAQNVFGGGFDAAHLSTADVDRIEVVRGPQSALYGSGAIGGVVNVVTRHGGRPALFASFEGGGYGTLRESVSATGSARVWQWGGSIEHLKTDGDTRLWPSLGRRVANEDYARVTGSGSFGWSDGPGRRVRVDVRADKNEAGNPGPYGSNPVGNYGGLDLIARGKNHSKEVGVSSLFGGTGTTRHTAQVTWSDLTNEFARQYGSSSDQTTRASGRYQFDAAIGVARAFGWRRAAPRAQRQHVHHGHDVSAGAGAQDGRRPVRRSAAVARPPGVSDRRRAAGAHRAQRSRSRPRDVQPAAGLRQRRRVVRQSEGLCGVVRARGRVGEERPRRRLDEDSLRRGHGHQAADRIRDRLHRQPEPQTRTQPQRRCRHRAGVRLDRRRRRHVVRQSLRRSHRGGRRARSRARAITAPTTSPTREAAASKRACSWRGRGGLAAHAAWTWLNTAVLGADGAPARRPAGSTSAIRSSGGRATRARSTSPGRPRTPARLSRSTAAARCATSSRTTASPADSSTPPATRRRRSAGRGDSSAERRGLRTRRQRCSIGTTRTRSATRRSAGPRR